MSATWPRARNEGLVFDAISEFVDESALGDPISLGRLVGPRRQRGAGMPTRLRRQLARGRLGIRFL